MLLKDLGQRYLDSVPALDELLDKKKAELRKADRNGNFFGGFGSQKRNHYYQRNEG